MMTKEQILGLVKSKLAGNEIVGEVLDGELKADEENWWWLPVITPPSGRDRLLAYESLAEIENQIFVETGEHIFLVPAHKEDAA